MLTAAGHSYERKFLEQHLRRSGGTDPLHQRIPRGADGQFILPRNFALVNAMEEVIKAQREAFERGEGTAAADPTVTADPFVAASARSVVPPEGMRCAVTALLNVLVGFVADHTFSGECVTRVLDALIRLDESFLKEAFLKEAQTKEAEASDIRQRL